MINKNLQLAQSIATKYLANFAAGDDFWQGFDLAFGHDYHRQIALGIKEELTSEIFSVTNIIIVDRQTIGNANGAFATENNTIYIAKDFLANNNSQQIAAILIEEIGHAIDSRINSQDSRGDEGQIFSVVVRGEKIDKAELAELKSENDRVIVTIDRQQLSIEQAAISIDYGDALSKSILFYEAQRSGDLPTNNRVPWRKDSALNDGSDVGRDLSGGYYDAGDHVKYGLPMASSMTMLSWGAIQYRSAYQQSGQLDEVMDAIKWGTDYILKANVVVDGKTTAFWAQVGAGNIDHSHWTAPETMTTARPSFKVDATHPGSDVAGESAAALAAASILFRATDVNYANKLLENAKQLFAFAKDADPNKAGEQRGIYSDSIADAKEFYPAATYEDELGWAGIWLYKATKAAGAANVSYLSDAEKYYSHAVLTWDQTDTWTQSWDDKAYGGMVLMAQELPNTSHYKTEVENWLNEWTTNNTTGAVKYTPGGLAWIAEWGSLRYTANTAFIAGIYADTVNDPGLKYSNFSRSQIEYILGKNPTGMSYMVGFGDKYPQRVHHAGASGLTGFGSGVGEAEQDIDNKYDIIGGLVGGPMTPADDIDDSHHNPNDPYTDARFGDNIHGQPLYIGNEVTLDYNAGLTGALARLYGLSAPNITLTVAPPTVSEDGATNLVYTFTRSNNITSALTVSYQVAGTATLATDYTQTGAASFSTTTGTVTFAAGASGATVIINPTTDPIFEANETVSLKLTSGNGYNVGTATAVDGTIVNDDPLPTISIADSTIVEGINGYPTQSLITVSLNKASTQAVKINYATSNGNAIASTDYTATSGTLTFAAGQTSLTIAVPILNDHLNEANEVFNIILSTPVNATISDDRAIVTISDTLSSNITTTLPALVENLTLTGTSAINGTGNTGNNVLTGNSANNTLVGLTGHDTYSYDADLAQGTDTINETNTCGIDTLDLSQTAVAVKINLGLTTVQTVNANLKLVIPVIALENVIGGAGNDRITGNMLANTLDGGSGNDAIFGGSGNDTISGGAGDDTIAGGAGNDNFCYQGLLSGAITISSLLGVDTIADFTSTQDKITLSKATFTAITSAAGTPIGGNFITVDDDSLVDTQSAAIVYSLNSGSLFYNQNGVAVGFGSKGGEFAHLLGSPTLTASDLKLV
jgi:Ca2+-binding RTX toxin-like protein